VLAACGAGQDPVHHLGGFAGIWWDSALPGRPGIFLCGADVSSP
jgi:hypothetical protein